MFKGLALMRKTSSNRIFNLASWHSPHSLTWRWVLSLRRHQVVIPKPYARCDDIGFGAGIGTLLSFFAYRTNAGWQWEASILWIGLHFSQQQPMWYRDMFWRADDEREDLRRRIRHLERRIEETPVGGMSTAQRPALVAISTNRRLARGRS